MSILPPLLYRGSVKNVRGEVSAESLLFEFSDRYSVFDWGEMPDQLVGKGAALAIMGKSFFQYLENPKNWIGLFESSAIQSHFDQSYLENLSNSKLYQTYKTLGLSHHALLSDDEYPRNSPYLKVKKVNVLKPLIDENQNYLYSHYKERPTNTLVPLEIIFRIGLSKGNSLTKRLGNDLSKWQSFGFDKVQESGSLLKKPFIDFSTKLERGDRYLDYSEAKEIAALTETEWTTLHQMTHLIALNLFSFHQKMGLELWDGKIEVAFSEDNSDEHSEDRSFMLVDSIGIDELRLLYKGKSFSKEFLREAYLDTPWYQALQNAKKESLLSGVDFKEICLTKYQAEPQKLDLEKKLRAIAVYKSYSNEVSALLGHERSFGTEYNLESYAQRYL